MTVVLLALSALPAIAPLGTIPDGWRPYSSFQKDGAVQVTYLAQPLDLQGSDVRSFVSAFCHQHSRRRFAKLFVAESELALQDAVYGAGFFEEPAIFVQHLHRRSAETGAFLDAMASRSGCVVLSRRPGQPLQEELIDGSTPWRLMVGSRLARVIWIGLMSKGSPPELDSRGLHVSAIMPEAPDARDAERTAVALAHRFGARELSLELRGDFLFDNPIFPGPHLFADGLGKLTLEHYLSRWRIHCFCVRGKVACGEVAAGRDQRSPM